jgi:DNA-binding CsgD family transcriptional regulator
VHPFATARIGQTLVVVVDRPGAHSTSPRRARPPLVGRALEMRRFATWMNERSTGLVLHGPIGVGKTRLAEEVIAHASDAGRVTRFVHGRASTEDLPLGPFAPLLPTGLERAEGVSLLVAARSAIEALGTDLPVVLGVDDAHLLDPASATLVHQLVINGTVQLIATIRDGEWVPEPIAELWRSGRVERHRVDALLPDDALAIAEMLVDATIPPQVGDELIRLTGGNPLFVTAMARAIRDSANQLEHGFDLDATTTAPTLVDFVAGKLSVLDPSARDALAAVALAEPIGLAVLEQLADPGELVALEQGGWLTVGQNGRRWEVRLAHPLYGEVLRRNLSRLLARTVYRELTVSVQAHGARRRDDLLRVALWSVEGGTPIPHDQLMHAADEATVAGDFSLAARLAESVWDAQPRFDAGYLMVFVHADRYTRDRAAFLDALASCTESPEQHAMVATAHAFEEFWRNSNLDAALAALDDAAVTPADGEPHDELDAHRATFLAASGRATDARNLIDRLRTTSSARARMTAVFAERMVETAHGDPRHVIDRLDQILSDARSLTNDTGMLSLRAVHAGFCRALVQLGQVHRAEQITRAAVDTASGNLRLAGTAEFYLGWTLIWRGRPAEGYRWAQRAASLQRQLGYRTLERWSRATMALSAAYAGELDLAEAAIATADRLSPHPTTVFDGDLWQARSAIATLRGDHATATQLVLDGIESSRERGMPYDEAMGWFALARSGRAAETVERSAELGDQLGGLAAMYALHNRGRAARDRATLGEAAEQFAEAGAMAIAAAVAGDAARAAERAGDQREASRWLRRAGELAASVQTRGEFVALPETGALSRREREVADLAVGGMSSRSIAEQLFLSTRTVESHLAQVFSKLGVTSRDELHEALAGQSTSSG